MFFTVAICTRNRCASLGKTLARLQDLNVDNLDCEVLVVDNASSDDTLAVLETFKGRLPLRAVSQPLVGVSHARNAAAREALGEYIMWTDDDVLVDSEWLQAYRRAVMRSTDAVFFGGPIRARFEHPPPDWLDACWPTLCGAYAVRDLGDVPFLFDRGNRSRWPYSANMVVRADVQRRFAFDPLLGRKGTLYIGGEEVEIVRRMVDDGYRGWWVPDAAVEHVIGADRLTLGYIRQYYIGQGMVRRIREGSAHLAGCAPWVWYAAIEAEHDYRAARCVGRPAVWIPKLIAASVARGRAIGPPREPT